MNPIGTSAKGFDIASSPGKTLLGVIWSGYASFLKNFIMLRISRVSCFEVPINLKTKLNSRKLTLLKFAFVFGFNLACNPILIADL